ncbi:MAG: helix-turn-helix domain-containing protein [Actinomycetes bacterium]
MSGPTSRDVSPFVFDGPVSPDQLIGRSEETAGLLAWARAGRFVALVAPRRYGKTSLLDAVADQAQREDLLPVTVDLYGVLSLTDLVLRLESAWQRAARRGERLRDTLGRVFAGAQVGLSVAGAGFSLRMARDPRTDPLPALHTLLDLPLQVAGKRGVSRVLLVLDEFQDLFRIEGAEAVLRSHAQHQREAASIVFSGSEPGMLAAAFGDRARPFYGQAEMSRLGRLPAGALAKAVDERFTATGRSAAEALPELVSASEGHPQRAMLLAHLLWTQTPDGGRADADTWQRTLVATDRRVSDEMAALWGGLSRGERKVLRAVQAYGSPYRSAAAQALDLPKSTAQEALRGLVARGVLEQEADEGPPLIVDPMLTRWVAHRAGA